MSIRDKFKQKIQQQKNNPLDTARSFLVSYWSDEQDIEAIENDLRNRISVNPYGIKSGLDALNTILKDEEIDDQKIINLVVWDANHPLDDPSVLEAKKWLRQAVVFVEQIISESK